MLAQNYQDNIQNVELKYIKYAGYVVNHLDTCKLTFKRQEPTI